MGFKDKFNNSKKFVENKLDMKEKEDAIFEDNDKEMDKFLDKNVNNYDEVGINVSQKPESFHHFLLEDKYKDAEMKIRGFKEIYDKEKQKWVVVRRSVHCFTDEEAEYILRTIQIYLSSSITLGRISREQYGIKIMAIHDEISSVFVNIATYKYCRYVKPEVIEEMHIQNHEIFVCAMELIKSNYTRSIDGEENKRTHDKLQHQESLRYGDKDLTKKEGYT